MSLSVRKDELSTLAAALDPKCKRWLDNESTAPVFIFSRFKLVISAVDYTASALSVSNLRFLTFTVLKQYIDTKRADSSRTPKILLRALGEMSKTENLRDGCKALMRLTNYSMPHLERLFTKHLGKIVHEYVKEQRLLCAHSLLVMTDRSVSEICDEVGYASLSHFNKVFKERFGITAARLRRSSSFHTV